MSEKFNWTWADFYRQYPECRPTRSTSPCAEPEPAAEPAPEPDPAPAAASVMGPASQDDPRPTQPMGELTGPTPTRVSDATAYDPAPSPRIEDGARALKESVTREELEAPISALIEPEPPGSDENDPDEPEYDPERENDRIEISPGNYVNRKVARELELGPYAR